MQLERRSRAEEWVDLPEGVPNNYYCDEGAIIGGGNATITAV